MFFFSYSTLGMVLELLSIQSLEIVLIDTVHVLYIIAVD